MKDIGEFFVILFMVSFMFGLGYFVGAATTEDASKYLNDKAYKIDTIYIYNGDQLEKVEYKIVKK